MQGLQTRLLWMTSRRHTKQSPRVGAQHQNGVAERHIRDITENACVCLFHFHDHVEKGLITIEHVLSKYQLANIFTKPLPHNQYMRLHDQIMGWTSTPLAHHEGV